MNAIATRDAQEIMERVLTVGDLSHLTPAERNEYYAATCRSLGLNFLTRPFDYIRLNGKLVLYAKRDAADQLRKIHGISLRILEQKTDSGLFVVTVEARDKEGRVDTDMGAVTVEGLKGEARANAILKCVTKGKRRVTLSICGLGFLDETEVSDIPPAERQAWEEPKAPARTEADGTVTRSEVVNVSTVADKPADIEMRTVIKIVGQDGTAHYTGSLVREALTAYGNCKRHSTDPGMVAVGNIEALRAILPYTRNGNHTKLLNEIQAAEAHRDALEHERRALDDQDGDAVDQDGVVHDRRAQDDDGEPPLAAGPA